MLLLLSVGKWQQCQIAGPLNCGFQTSLMLGADARFSWRENFRLRGSEFPQRLGFFKVDVANVLRAEVTMIRRGPLPSIPGC